MKHAADLEYLALLEERDRRAACASFLAFYMRMTGFMPPRHVRVVAKALQAVEDDKIDRLMVFMPPRHAKTTLCTQLFPAWIIGRYPTTAIMSVVHTQRYAGKVGRKVRNLLTAPQWPFDVTLADDLQAREQWATPQGGEYNAFGAIGGNQHGNPAEWLFLDDIVKGRKDAMSEHMRTEVWETYKTDLLSRLQGRRKQIMTYTRWHEDDPAGRILPPDFDGKTGWYKDRETGESWYVLSLPAVSEHDNDPLGRRPGEWLWPEEFGEAKLGGMRRRGGWMWSALFQQRPSPLEGVLFSMDHIQRYDPARLDMTGLQIYGSSDYAVTDQKERPDPDYTVHGVWGVDEDWNIYLLDGWRGQATPDVWVRAFISLVDRHKPLRWFEEQGQIIKAVGPFLRRQMLEANVYTDRVQIASTTDKVQRSSSLLGHAAMGKLYLPDRDKVSRRMLAFLDAFEKELLQFPGGRHDDTVDMATLFARALDRIVAGQRSRRHSPHEHTLEDLFRAHDR